MFFGGSCKACLSQCGAVGRFPGTKDSKTSLVSQQESSEDGDFASEGLHGHVSLHAVWLGSCRVCLIQCGLSEDFRGETLIVSHPESWPF